VSERRTDEREPAEDFAEPPGAARDEGVESRPRFDFARALKVAACALFAAAGALLIYGRPEAAFIVAGLGASAWFLHVRNALISKHDLVKVGGRNWRPRREVERETGEDDEDGDEG
jgi:hypothetical protein